MNNPESLNNNMQPEYFGPENPEKETEESMDPKTLALTTATFYPKYGEGALYSPDNVRGRLAVNFLRGALEDGYRVIVVDDKSSPEWRKELEKFVLQGLIVEDQLEPGLSAGRRQALEVASRLKGVRVVAQTEVEKIDMEKQAKKLAIPVLNGEAVVVVPNRGEKGMENYPVVQKESEFRANRSSNVIVRNKKLLANDAPDIDWWNGTRFIKNDPEIIGEFLKKRVIEGEHGLYKKSKPGDWSDAIFTPIVDVLKKTNGKGVKSIDIVYSHPTEQTASEQGNIDFEKKRVLQRHSITTNIFEEIRSIEADPKKPSRLHTFERFKGEKIPFDVLFFNGKDSKWLPLPLAGKKENLKIIEGLCAGKNGIGFKKEQVREELAKKKLSAKAKKSFMSVLPSSGLFDFREVDLLQLKCIAAVRTDVGEKYPNAPIEIFLAEFSDL